MDHGPIPSAIPRRSLGSKRSGYAGRPGFSLVEMAVVLVLMSMMLTLGIAAFSVQQDHAAASATQRKLEAIKDALVAYLRVNKRLPCPETTAFDHQAPNGTESRQTPGDATSLCQSYWGTLPYAPLGLPRDTALDGYDNLFTYFVSSAQSPAEPDWTLTQNSSATPIVPGFSAGNPGRYAITENGTPTTLPANRAVVVIVSHGKNGAGAFTIKGTRNVLPNDDTDERTNAPHIPVLPQSPPTSPLVIATLNQRDRSDAFDDIVLALRPNDLLTPLIKDGAIKSAQAQVQDALNAALLLAAGSGCTPPNKVSDFTNWLSDPWNNKILYQRIRDIKLSQGCTATNATTTTTSQKLDTSGIPITDASGNPVVVTTTTPNCFGPAVAPGTEAFRVWSSGPNGINDSTNALNDAPNGDDIARSTGTWSATYLDMINLLGAANCP